MLVDEFLNGPDLPVLPIKEERFEIYKQKVVAPHAKAFINGQAGIVYLDTGSEVSIIDSDFLETLQKDHNVIAI